MGTFKTIVSVSERWVSPDLKELLASSMDDPREQQTREVTQMERTEQDKPLKRDFAKFASLLPTARRTWSKANFAGTTR
jgi:hypothetical protein